MHRILLLLAVGLLLTGCGSSSGLEPGIDQQPMYGGIDRRADPRFRAADEQFIAAVTKQWGSREKASAAFVEQGIRFYQQDDYATAMKRFNQGWLMDPQNPEVFWGFAMVYHDHGRNCDAKQMIDRALQLGLSKPISLADAGRIYTLCAVSDASLDQSAKGRYFARSEQLYQQAIAGAPNNDYIYGSWATARYWQGDYAGAWMMVKKQRAAGGTPPGQLLNLLRAKMPEPKA